MTRTTAAHNISRQNAHEFRGQVLEWYARHARDLPWRFKEGEAPDPYRVWLSEIMLQQTTVTAVWPYFTKFLQKWPTIQDLATAPQEEVMACWAGLGYYARARNLHKCAQRVVRDHNGIFPQDQAALKTLPGIGDYTSAAILTIAFNKPATVIDGNIERIMARYHLVGESLPKSKPLLKDLAARYFESCENRPGGFAQALMDIGAGICIPKNPRCGLCPLAGGCKGFIAGSPELLPKRETKKRRPQKTGHVYWITNERGQVLIQRRPQKGLLGGMMGLPTSEWTEASKNAPHAAFPFTGRAITQDWNISIHHVFTHFDLELRLASIALSDYTLAESSFFWLDYNELDKNTFPSVFQKALAIFKQAAPQVAAGTRTIYN